MSANPAAPRMSNEVTVGELARRSGLAVSAVHFYESKGLINSWRTSGNQRRYPRAMLRRLAIIKVAQRIGVPLSRIGDALGTLPESRTPTKADWKRLSAVWRQDLNDRIDKLTSLRDSLSECIGCGCLSLTACPLRNPSDALARDGTGPRLLDP